MISADRMKSVVMAPETILSSCSLPLAAAGVAVSSSWWPRRMPQILWAPS